MHFDQLDTQHALFKAKTSGQMFGSNCKFFLTFKEIFASFGFGYWINPIKQV